MSGRRVLWYRFSRGKGMQLVAIRKGEGSC